MSIAYALHRRGRPTGRVVTVPEPHEVTASTAKRTVQAQARQKRIVQKLDASKKWKRTTETAPDPVPDIDALVEKRVAEELARRSATSDAPVVKATAARKPTAPKTAS